MATTPAIELSSLPGRHPVIGQALLSQFGAQLIIRLSLDPIPRTCTTCEVMVDRKSHQPLNKTTVIKRLGWNGLPQFSIDYCKQIGITLNEQRITEDAAIGIMAILVNELEGATIQSVLPIGSGADYCLQLLGAKGAFIEVSGIREDTTGHQASSRLHSKCAQILGLNQHGFASVTTFKHCTCQGTHSYLHFVVKPTNSRGKRRS